MDQVQQKVRTDNRLRLLMELTAQINSNLELNSLLSDIIRAAKILTNSEASSLFLLDEKTDELVLSIPTGPATEDVSGKRIPKDKGLAGWILTNEDSVIVNDVDEDPRFGGDFNPRVFKTENLIGVPMLNRSKKVIGVLEAMNKKGGKEFKKDDLSIFQMLANQAAIAIEKARLHEEERKKQLLEQKLELARSIQTGFWPEKPPSIDGYDVAGTSRPATQVGGDYFDFIQTGQPNHYGFTVADVTGKGMPASLLMASVRSVLRTQIENGYSIRKTMQLVNHAIFNDTPIDKFITLFYGDLNYKDHTFKYINAGHTETFLVDYNTNEIRSLTKGGVMLGIQEEIDYDVGEVELEPGQQIVIYTDGIDEAQNAEGEFYGIERFKNWLLKHPNSSASETMELLIKEIENFRGTNKQTDDITLIFIKRNE